MEGFLQRLKLQYNNIKFPNSITNENVNLVLWEDRKLHTFFELAIRHSEYKLFPILISLGALFTGCCMSSISSVRVAKALFKYGIDLTKYDVGFFVGPFYTHKLGFFLIDMGCLKPYYNFRTHHKETLKRLVHYYNNQVLPRISSCRQSLLALLWCCTQRSSHGKGPFGGGAGFAALSNMMIQMATQVWCMRGGDGCGPRGHLWIKL